VLKGKVGIIVGVLLAMAVVVAGCGSGSDEPSVTKAEFTKKANAVCLDRVEKRNIALEAAYKKETGKYFSEPIDPKIEEMIFRTVYLPEMQLLAKELSEIGYPDDDEGKAQEFVETLEAANDTISKNSEKILLPNTKTPVHEVDELAQENNFGNCIII